MIMVLIHVYNHCDSDVDDDGVGPVGADDDGVSDNGVDAYNSGDALLMTMVLVLSVLMVLVLHIAGKLVLKIPWKNLYTEAVVAEIDGIYALAVPNAGKFKLVT